MCIHGQSIKGDMSQEMNLTNLLHAKHHAKASK